MTGYHITVGYLSDKDKDDAWRELKLFVEFLCERPWLIAREAVAFGMDDEPAKEYSEYYRNCQGLTIKIKEAEDDRPAQIMQLASGGGSERKHKEAMRRAFCRLVLSEMHRREIEVNINVA